MSTTKQPEPSPLAPPPERFWTRYSPHHELPLAGTTSFFVHALVIGLLALAGVLYLFQRESEQNKPPSMDLIQVAGGGDGLAGIGGEPGLPGEASRTELTQTPINPVPEILPDTAANLKEAPQVELTLPEITSPETAADAESILAKLEKDATERMNLEKAKKDSIPSKKPATPRLVGTGNPKGTGGQGGSGGGFGKGTRGTGPGAGGPGGLATKAQIYAIRWDFLLHGSGKDHVTKCVAMGAKVAVLGPDQQYYTIQDLRRRPVELRPEKLPDSKEVVMWGNNLPASIQGLAAELKLSFIPAKVVIFLPKEQEQVLADAELRHAKKAGRRVEEIQKTFFDFQLRNGHYEPVVIGQQ
jgi:hypothetical protein